MRLESALNTSREGLSAHGQAIAVVGDNIANASTPGFKRGRAEFRDIMGEIPDSSNSEVVSGSGDGVSIGRTRQNFETGALDITGRSLDVALTGNGFFLVGDVENPLFTRMGTFQVSTDGFLTTSAGLPVLGYQGADTTTLTSIDMNKVNIEAQATTNLQLFGNIDGTQINATPPPAGSSFKEITTAASFVASQGIFDSLGQRHDVTMCFFKGAGNQWTVQSYVNGSDTGAGVDVPVLVGQATLAFNPVGRIDEANAAAAAINGTINWANGAAASPITIDLKSFTQYAGGSLVTNAFQDGRGAGEISSYEFDTNGGIYAILDTGERAQVGSLPVAIFQNVDGLERSGSSVYSSTIDAGEMQLGTPGRGARGGLKGAALESSNVDIANQFVDLVIYQRGYQANSQVLSAASEILKGTIAMIR